MVSTYLEVLAVAYWPVHGAALDAELLLDLEIIYPHIGGQHLDHTLQYSMNHIA